MSLDDSTQEEINAAFYRFLIDPVKWQKIDRLFGQKENIFWSYGEILYMRFFVNFGAPIEYNGVRYNDATDRKEEQDEIVKQF